MRESYQALPSWLSRLPPEAPPTPALPHRLPDTILGGTILGGRLVRRRLRFHVALLAVALGVGAATVAGSVRARHEAESRAQMSAYATAKVAELRAVGALRAARTREAASPLAPGGSLTDDVPGYSDLVEGTNGRRFRRRWVVDLDSATDDTGLAVRVLPASREAAGAPLDLTTVLTRR
jgi:hypothetical protein